MLAPVRTVAPSVTPVTLTEAKAHCRVDHTDEDTLITSLIETATAHLDGYSGILGRALITQTWRQDFKTFTDCMRLPVGDLIAVSSVTYYDTNNDTQTLSTDIYTAFTDAQGPFLTLKPDQDWPSVYSREDAVRVTWTAGYGAAGSSVPTPIKHAILLLVGHWYASRETVMATQTYEVPVASYALVAPFRRVPL